MNAYDEARLRVLAALFVDYHRPAARLIEVSDIRSEYHVTISDALFEGVVAASKGIFKTCYTKDGPAAHLKASGYGDVLRELLEWIDATSLEIDWKKEEITTDGRFGNRLPSMNGWKLITFARDSVSEPIIPISAACQPIDWTKWGTIIGALALVATIVIAVVH